ncbi:aminotransferase class I/II-fold pyridoxal phosphate-dependent enzyme [Lignipirellula cremea]|uniref:aminotransferase class I/II-fold pyridoxal phosphate-dependent enzyme n=1 Tax=Lignipirellula cremea TaxID=2528010 RepID=UPI001E4D7C83|nr:8-amino-7-oxononanoate synthase [Lignipirellula cremea]
MERTTPQTADRVQVAGRTCINFGANDYLALANDPRLAQAVQDVCQNQGWGAGASPLVTGRAALHALLEKRLAALEKTEAALLFPSGFAANVGAITALVGRGDLIFSDAKNHASIIDGCRLSGARIEIYHHADADDLARRLQAASAGLALPGSPTRPRLLIATDSLFSMDGDLAPLPAIAELAERYGAMLLLDEAHATGVFGAEGRGVAEFLQAEHPAHIRVGTLSKALGSVGGFVAGEQRLIDWLANRARTFVFSTAAPEATAAASLAALDIVRDEPQRRQLLLERADTLRQTLQAEGWNTGGSTSQILPLIVGDPNTTMQLHQQLADAGLFVPGIRPPTVPAGESLLRISLSYGHSAESLAQLVDVLKPLRPR